MANRPIRRVTGSGKGPLRVKDKPTGAPPFLHVKGLGRPGGVFRIKRGMPAPENRKPILHATGEGRPRDSLLKVKRPSRPARKKPGRPKKPKRKPWRQTVGRPAGFAMPSLRALPPGVEAWIDIAPGDRGIYRLMRAAAHNPDHIHDAKRDYWECNHPRNASSWFACIGLIVLESGGLGLYAKTWKGTELAWYWSNDDVCITFYQMMKAAPSKGKFCRGKLGPSYLWNQPYRLLAGR